MNKAEIYYCDIGDYLSRDEKLELLRKNKSFSSPDMKLTKLTPNEHGDWITSRNEAFQNFIPLASEKKFDVKTKSIFVIHSLGINTNRDAWVYNFSYKEVLGNMESMLEFYNSQIGKTEPSYDSEKISWSSSLMSY